MHRNYIIIPCTANYFQSDSNILSCKVKEIGKKHKVKGTVSDKKNLQITLDIKKNTFQSQYVPFFSKNCIILTEKQLFIRFHSVGNERRFSTQKEIPKFLDKISGFSFQ